MEIMGMALLVLAEVAAEVVLDMDDPVLLLAYVIQVPAAAAVWGFWAQALLVLED
jgi:hypothetical protein